MYHLLYVDVIKRRMNGKNVVLLNRAGIEKCTADSNRIRLVVLGSRTSVSIAPQW